VGLGSGGSTQGGGVGGGDASGVEPPGCDNDCVSGGEDAALPNDGAPPDAGDHTATCLEPDQLGTWRCLCGDGHRVTREGDRCVESSVLRSVWAVHDGEKVERTELTHPSRARNSAWDGRRVRIFGGRNEMLGFQLVAESAEAVRAITVSLPELRQRGGDAVIRYRAPGLDPSVYVDRPIQVFSQHYLNVTEPTSAHWITQPSRASAPVDMRGEKPVALVPENAAPGRGGLPVSMAARRTQAFWFDVYTPRDLPAGFYDGMITLTADGEEWTVPVELEVFDFALPEQNSWNAMVYFEAEQTTRYHGTDRSQAYHRLAHRSRIEFVRSYDVTSATQNAGRFSGTEFTRRLGYEGPGEGVGNRIIPRTMYSPGTLFDERQSAWRESDAWMRYLDANIPGAITLLYMPDEPSSSEFDRILRIGRNIDENPGPGRRLPVFVTHGYASTLAPAIDIWCTGANQYSTTRAAAQRERGGDMWFYNGQRPHAGSLLVDSPATDPRVQAWASYKHGAKVYFYWHANHWYHNSQSPSGYERTQNVWVNPITFRNRSGGFANGDGVLVLPGEDVIHREQNRGIEGPVATIQLLNLRRGAQDHLYLSLLAQQGRSDLVSWALQQVVPRVLDETRSDQRVSFPENGDAFEEVRYRLAQALAERTVTQ
jgi:hypothetical protein